MQEDKNEYIGLTMALWRNLSKKIHNLKFEHVDSIVKHIKPNLPMNKTDLLINTAKIKKLIYAWQKYNFEIPSKKQTINDDLNQNKLNHIQSNSINYQQNNVHNDVLPIPKKSNTISYLLVLDAYDRDQNIYPQINPFQISIGKNIKSSIHNIQTPSGHINQHLYNVIQINLLDVVIPRIVIHPDIPGRTIDILEFPYIMLTIDELQSNLLYTDQNNHNIFGMIHLEPSSSAQREYVKYLLRIPISKKFMPSTTLNSLTFTFKYANGKIIEFPQTNTQNMTNPIINHKRGLIMGPYSQQLVIWMEIHTQQPTNEIETLIPA